MKKILLFLLDIVAIGTSAVLLVYNLFVADVADYSRVLKCVVVLAGYLYGTRNARKPLRINYKKYEEAYKNALEGAFAEDKRNYKKLLQVAVCHNRCQFEKAYKLLDKLENKCTCSKDYFAIYMFRGLCYAKEDMHTAAVEAYQKAAHYNMANAVTWSNMGLSYMYLGKFQEAYDALINAINIDPKEAYAYHNMAELLINANEPEASLAYSMKAFELDSRLIEALGMLALAYKRLGDEENYEKYCKLYGDRGGDAKGLRATLETKE